MINNLSKFLFLLLILSHVSLRNNAQDMRDGYSVSNIGNPAIPGETFYCEDEQSFTLTGSGYNVWFARDEFLFLSRKVKGDFIYSANLEFPGKGVNAHRKMGLMARNSFDENSPYADAVVHGDGLTSMQFRDSLGGATLEERATETSPVFVQLERNGNTFIMRISKNNQPLQVVATKEIKLSETVQLGLFVCSHDVKISETAKFRNVRLEIPAPESAGESSAQAASRLEILEIESGQRKIIYETGAHIEAPNWSPDGNYLIYNADGRLFRFDLKKKLPELINTGSVTSSNNDHGISFDGKLLAVSNHLNENGKKYSVIFTLPIEGGNPTRITKFGPSYWHGWSPDGKYLVYCAERSGNYDVYRIPAGGGEETRLTSSEGLDDGPEYSPDGKYIYFNSVRSGKMKIWRMKPDGTGEEQVTTDEYQDWFAHPSPDGKWLLFISYLPDVPAGSHPGNKRVMLRIMPAGGGPVKTIAFLYGGQGTINVPSWSPDSKKVAFVSFTY